MFHNTEEWHKVLKKLTLGSKKDRRNLVNFNPTTQKFKKFHFDGQFLSKVYDVWAKEIRRSYTL